MREALATHLEQLSYYQHQELTGGIERPIHAFRVLDVRGTRYFVLSRIQDAGLDFTKRTNFVAHHLVFTPEEIATLGSPPLLFLYWDGWKPSWDGEPELLANENWGNLHTIKGFESDPGRHYETAPARYWEQLTGAAVNAFGLLELRGSAWLAANKESDEVLLRLLAESLRMLELRNRDVDFRAKAWEFTFTTNFQEQDNPSDFRWRCVHTEAISAGKRQAEAVPLHEVRSKKHSAEESDFATIGPHPAVIVKAPTEVTVNEGQDANLQVDARGVPYPDVEWYWNGKLLTQFSNSECVIRNLKPGSGQFCEVRVRNAYNHNQVSTRIAVHVNFIERSQSNNQVTQANAKESDDEFYKRLPTDQLIGSILNEGPKHDFCVKLLHRTNPSFEKIEHSIKQNLFKHCSRRIDEPFMAEIRERCAKDLSAAYQVRLYFLKNPFRFCAYAVLALFFLSWLTWVKGWPWLDKHIRPESELRFSCEPGAFPKLFEGTELAKIEQLHLVLRFSPTGRKNGTVRFHGIESNNIGEFTVSSANNGARVEITAPFASNAIFMATIFTNAAAPYWGTNDCTIERRATKARSGTALPLPMRGKVTIDGYRPPVLRTVNE